MLSIIGTIIAGFLVGLVARFLYPGAVPAGFVVTTLLGIGGSFFGAFIGSLFSADRDMTKLRPAGCLMSIVGALLLIFIAHRFGVH